MTIDMNQEWMTRLASAECHDATYQPSTSPLVFERALGSYIWDVEGKKYVDLCAGFGSLAFGHNSDVFRLVLERHFGGPSGSTKEVTPYIEHGMGDVYPSKAKIELLSTLKSHLPNRLTKGTLALTGGQAVEIAVKSCLLATKKSGFLTFSDSYHGVDLGILPLTARADFKDPFSDWHKKIEVRSVPYGASDSVVRQAIQSLQQTKSGFAGCIVEPIQGRAGVILPPKGWLEGLAKICHDHGGLIVLDEIFTGFGRTGILSESFTVDADLCCFGKAIGGGMPMSACFGTEEVMSSWPKSSGEAIHTGTFVGHPLSCEVARQTVDRIVQDQLPLKATQVGEKLISELKDRYLKRADVVDIRGQGFMIGIQFSKEMHAAKLMDHLRTLQIIALPSGPTGSVLSVTPALNIDEATLKDALAKVLEASLHLV